MTAFEMLKGVKTIINVKIINVKNNKYKKHIIFIIK
jgi:hypothetical protein